MSRRYPSSSLCRLDQPDGERDERGGDEQRATSGELRADRGPAELADGHVQEEAARLTRDSREQNDSGDPFRRVGEIGTRVWVPKTRSPH
jgi:hypothetical protein